jgi:hypothetical protein
MLIITTPNNQPTDFWLLAQNMQTYEICGYSNAEGYAVINDIPAGFEQRCLPPDYGEHLALAQIERGMTIERTLPDIFTPAQKRQKSYDYLPLIEWEGEQITVTAAAQKCGYYIAETYPQEHPKAVELAGKIADAKAIIRGMYPDENEED